MLIRFFYTAQQLLKMFLIRKLTRDLQLVLAQVNKYIDEALPVVTHGLRNCY